jgi:hypothetical protein
MRSYTPLSLVTCMAVAGQLYLLLLCDVHPKTTHNATMIALKGLLKARECQAWRNSVPFVVKWNVPQCAIVSSTFTSCDDKTR